MKRVLLAVLTIALSMSLVSMAIAKDDAAKIKALEKRLQKLEMKSAKDRVEFTGDLRVEAHTITGEINDYINGMQLQAMLVNSMFMMNHSGGGGPLPTSPAGWQGFVDNVNAYITDSDNYADYMMFTSGLDFASLKGMMANVDPAMVGALMSGLSPFAYTEGYKTDNDILYTTRLRLNMAAKVAKNVSFAGRLAMYKPWGASTAIPAFNGQANTMAMDASSPGVPGGETFRVERAYFTWKKIADKPMYLSLGRRPSTNGPPLHYRQDELRAGTPLGTIIDFQFDGATFGYNLGDKTIIRACYGLGYESQFGNASILNTPANRLKDASFFGFNVDAYQTEDMVVQATVARAFNVTDGFNGYVIMPNNPVTGQAMPGPIVTRYSPSANLGDFDLASLLLARRDGPVDWFVSGSWSKSNPEDVTTAFGGLLCDPFSTPESETGSMYYLGARFNFNEDKTKIGLEYNKGSQYWFNFAPAQDDLIAPKTSTRGTVIEAYVTHRLARRFVVKLAYINYDYDYSGSGWHMGAPKDLDEVAMLGFPTYKKVGKLSLGFSARF